MTVFPPETLAALHAARTVRIETSRGPGSPVHETIIWLVVDDVGRVLVRAVRGTGGRWFRELMANPTGAVVVDGTRVPIRAELAADAERIDACSRALEAKFPRSGASLASMLRKEVLGATLELHPA